jgi:hypothetical protein
MASWQLELSDPPQEERALELWLQHAVGRILFEDVRAYAMARIEQTLPAEARAAAQKGIDDSMYGLMMVFDGVSGILSNETQRLELAVQAKLVNRGSKEVVMELDLKDGDGMCMGYHDWLQGDFGEEPVVAQRSERGIE